MEPREGGVTPLDRWPLSVQKKFSGLNVLQICISLGGPELLSQSSIKTGICRCNDELVIGFQG